MSIYEYDQEKHIRQEREASWEEGREALLKEQIQKKLAKGYSIPDIADALEEDQRGVFQNIPSDGKLLFSKHSHHPTNSLLFISRRQASGDVPYFRLNRRLK